jgi:hypothetical protein
MLLTAAGRSFRIAVVSMSKGCDPWVARVGREWHGRPFGVYTGELEAGGGCDHSAFGE